MYLVGKPNHTKWQYSGGMLRKVTLLEAVSDAKRKFLNKLHCAWQKHISSIT